MGFEEDIGFNSFIKKTNKHVPGVRKGVLAVWHGSVSLNFHQKGFQCWLKEIAQSH